MARREAVPAWLILAALIAIGANVLATAMTNVTIGLMGSMTEFAVSVRAHDLALLPYYLGVVYPAATLASGAYLWPIVQYFRHGVAEPASAIVQRRTVNSPLVIAGIGLLPWLISATGFPIATLIHFGSWAPELASQQVVSPLVNGFLAATVIYLVLDWLFRSIVVPSVFPHGRLAEVTGVLALGVRGRLVVFLLAAAFTPLFTVLGLIRAATAHVATGPARPMFWPRSPVRARSPRRLRRARPRLYAAARAHPDAAVGGGGGPAPHPAR
jgi:hypothetical protein